MPRPIKWRNVKEMPSCTKFGPLGEKNNQINFVRMSVDEYETIRLIDLLGLNQTDAAKQMNVARATVQGIYQEARKKIAESLVNGKVLLIEGGEYKLCGSDNFTCTKKKCCMNHEQNIENASCCKRRCQKPCFPGDENDN